MPTLTFLGTSGWYDSPTGNTVCALIETKKEFIILDAGFGIHKLDKYIPAKTKKRLSLFLSHFHLDHIVGLHTLNKGRLSRLRIYGPKGLKKALRDIMRPPYSFDIKKALGYPIETVELDTGIHEVPFTVEARYLKHVVPCMGYRFTLDDKVITYCTDTGVCPGLKELAKGADLLVLECSYLPGERHPEWPHLNPQECGMIAKEAGAGQLVLTHFDAGRYDTMAKRAQAGKIAKRIFRNTVVAKDGLRFDI